MIQKQITTADQLRHNLKEIVLNVINGQDVVLKYGNLGEILLTNIKPVKATKKQTLLRNLKIAASEKTSTKKPSYKNNQEMYQDLMNKFI